MSMAGTARSLAARAWRNVRRVAMQLSKISKSFAMSRSEISQLRTENAYQLHTIRRLMADCNALRAENATFRTRLQSLAGEQRASTNAPSPGECGNPANSVADPAAATRPLTLEAVGRYLNAPLVDLGSTDRKYAGVLCPEPEIHLPRVGVTETLLSGAEEYFQKYQHYGYMFRLLQTEIDALAVTPRGIAVDFGSGFGNTVLPLLEHFPDLSIIASDISPDLLAILLREASNRGFRDRCAAIAYDAQREYFVHGFADMVFGGAVLHHLAEPEALLKVAIDVLKPGGHAIFFEPFENGHAVLRRAYEEIVERARSRGETGPGLDFLQALVNDIAVRTHRQAYPGFSEKWLHLDDKWLFARNHLEQSCIRMGASAVRVRPFNDPTNPFTAQTCSALVNYAGLAVPDALPEWAWKIIRHFDEQAFSPELLRDHILEGAVVITK